jgi:hypothetical protein
MKLILVSDNKFSSFPTQKKRLYIHMLSVQENKIIFFTSAFYMSTTMQCARNLVTMWYFILPLPGMKSSWGSNIGIGETTKEVIAAAHGGACL